MENSVLALPLFALFYYVIYRYVYNPPSDDFIETQLKRYWVGQGFTDVEVYKLTVSEKSKYGVPLIPLSKFMDMAFSFISTLPFVTNRKIEMVDTSGQEWTKYVEVRFFNGTMTGCKEFDGYEI